MYVCCFGFGFISVVSGRNLKFSKAANAFPSACPTSSNCSLCKEKKGREEGGKKEREGGREEKKEGNALRHGSIGVARDLHTPPLQVLMLSVLRG